MLQIFLLIYKKLNPFVKKLTHDNIYAIAGQSAFFLILSSVPLLMFGVSILQNFHIPEESLEKVFGTIFNEEITRTFSKYVSNLYKDTTGISVITLIVTLWSASKGVHAIINGLNRVHHTYENRRWIVLRLRAMFSTVVIFAIAFASMFLIMLSSNIKDWIDANLVNLPGVLSFLFNFRYIIIFIYVIFMFAMMYRNFPNLSREQRKEFSFSSQLPGALFTTVAWFVLTIVISIYVTDFNGFSIYGGLLRLAVIMVWLYFCMISLMIGAEINYFYHKQIKSFSRIFSVLLRRNKKEK